jgi:Reverse transcriptase (RNA-dependent DNA polymerase).
MKTYSNLFNKICTIENFREAYLNAIKGKMHYREVIEIEKDRDTYLANLLEEVRSKRYKVSEYIIFNLFTGHKMREIFKLPMRDRIVQHAIMIHCEPIFRETFILDTYASTKTRGIHLGLQRVKKSLKKHHYKYCLKLDIHKCYPSLDKEILKSKLAKKFKDPDLLDLLNKIVDSCEKGVPIGNYTSQYFNNFYFSDFDHWIKEVKGVNAYFRYCDDMVILSNSKEELHTLLGEIKEYMKTLNVHLKENYQLFPVSSRGISFLGYIITEDCIKIRKATKKNFVHKVSRMDFTSPSAKDINVLGSYWGILVHADCRNLWKSYIGCDTFKTFMKRYKCSARDILNKPIRVLKAYRKYSSGKWWTVMEVKVGNLYAMVKTTSKYLAVVLDAKLPFDTYIIATQKGYRFNTNLT